MPSSRTVALITGAAPGIDKELARLLAADHDLILTARREANCTLGPGLTPAGATCIPVDTRGPNRAAGVLRRGIRGRPYC